MVVACLRYRSGRSVGDSGLFRISAPVMDGRRSEVEMRRVCREVPAGSGVDWSVSGEGEAGESDGGGGVLVVGDAAAGGSSGTSGVPGRLLEGEGESGLVFLAFFFLSASIWGC